MKKALVCTGNLLILCIMITVCIGQDLIVYPADGQSQEQMDKDKYECYTWAKQQTGFDPMVQSSASTTTQQVPRGGLVRGGARGALIGVAAGAIAGDAGKGAGIGATVGALGGAMR